MKNFVDVILPIPIQKEFTYSITELESEFIKKGMRVAVEFGKNKIYTGLVVKIHKKKPIIYQTKDIFQILDDEPIVNSFQIKHWKWLSDYYMCPLGDVFKASLPSAFLLESETKIYKKKTFNDQKKLNDQEYLIYEALENQSSLTIQQISEILEKKKVLPIINELIKKSVIYIKEEIYEIYKPNKIKYIRLNNKYDDKNSLELLLKKINNAKKQREALLAFFQLKVLKKPIKSKDLLQRAKISNQILKALIDKKIFEFYYLNEDRINFKGSTNKLKKLNEYQKKALIEIKNSFKKNNTTLLHGVTSSGKTEIYSNLIQECLNKKQQILFLVPEIALTTQIINRLQFYFGDKISVFHSKYSINERVEVWNNVLKNKPKAQIILGARSSIFLPFSKLGLIIIDEEHEKSYKQNEPNPRYNARDSAIFLGKMHNAKVLLGSATPSIESYYNSFNKKYGLVELTRRHKNVKMPIIELIDIKEKYRKKLMNGHFSDTLLSLINSSLDNKEQVIIFQNRRGFSPIIECSTCGISPQCPNCDISLTYHKYKDALKCHYCYYQRAMPKKCDACGSVTLDNKGFGTEQIEQELNKLFPSNNIGRMDLDTTRGKYGYQKIIGAFQAKELDILVGTQMLSKGLDFNNVSLVGILNADRMLNFPDFRANERAYQLMVQVSGRSGRCEKQGKVAIQTFNPDHQILQQVSTISYKKMYKEQLNDRWQYNYPPFFKLIKITLKHKDFLKANNGIKWLANSLRNSFKDNVLGPSTPSIPRIRNKYIQNIILKIPPKQSLVKTKEHLYKIKNSFEAINEFRSIRLIIDVDPY